MACSTVISPRVSLYVTLDHPVQLFVPMKAWRDVPISRPGHPGQKRTNFVKCENSHYNQGQKFARRYPRRP